MTIDEFYKALKRVRSGIYTWVYPGDRVIVNSAKDLELLLRDPVGLMAKHFDVPREIMASYIEWHEDGMPCRGRTKAGKPCKSGTSQVASPEDFIEGITDRCILHTERPKLYK